MRKSDFLMLEALKSAPHLNDVTISQKRADTTHIPAHVHRHEEREHSLFIYNKVHPIIIRPCLLRRLWVQ